MAKRKAKSKVPPARSYQHPESQVSLRPDVGTQAQFKKKKPPATYRYDSSLSPALDWDGQNSAREQGERELSVIGCQLSVAMERLYQLRDALLEVAVAIQAAGDAETAQQLRHQITDNCQLTTDNLSSAAEAAQRLAALSRPFLNWAGKAERLSFDVPTLPLFVHERLSTKAIIETLTGHKRQPAERQAMLFDLFADPQHSITDQVLRAYEYQDDWVNRMILGDSLVVMNSLLHYENLGGQVQMIYMDPPYGVKFGSNFQPFVRKRDVKHGDDEHMTREPEMVQAYRDTWEVGLHSYLTYLRDRLLLCRELLHPSGSVFVQISDENVHYVRELLDETFGPENFQAQINFKSTSALGAKGLAQAYDYILWYARDFERMKFRPLYKLREIADDREWRFLDDKEAPDGYRKLSETEFRALPSYQGLFRRSKLTSSGYTESCTFDFELSGHRCRPYGGKSWVTTSDGIKTLIEKKRIFLLGTAPNFKQYYTDFPYTKFDNCWSDQPPAAARLYVVQTADKFIQRCMMMTTDPGDLMLDPTCGSGTTAYVAEQWGRRWITVDTSRVPLALARQRLLTATFPWYELKDESRGPASGFVYKRKQNKKGEDVGGIVPHVTLKSIANNEPPAEEVLVDRPESVNSITRVTGPFCFEATIPTPVDWDGKPERDGERRAQDGSFEERLLEILRKSPVLRLEGNRTVTLHNIRPPAKSLSLSAEAMVDSNGVRRGSLDPAETPDRRSPAPTGDLQSGEVARSETGHNNGLSRQPVAFVFGPENGAVSQRLVFEAAREAYAKSYTHLYVIGFAIQPNARELIENSAEVVGVPATYVQATPDLLMGDLLKNMRSSQIFSVCGLPEIKLSVVGSQLSEKKGRTKKAGNRQLTTDNLYQVELIGLDVFDPMTMEVDSRAGHDVPCWLLDTDYNELCFHVSQAFFPRTAAWDNLKKALKGDYDETVWDHLAGTQSAPFEAGEHQKVAVKVIDDRGNELLVVRKLSEVAK